MELPQAGANGARAKLTEVRQSLLDLHKALLDSERTAYEIVHGPIGSPGAFLQLLINDNWFAWLRPITTLLVQIDETLAAKKPPATERDFEQLITDTKALLSASRAADEFWARYAAVVERDPGVAKLHAEMERRFQ
ncbi:MAG: hypothetical protein JOY54_02040 [Acidobacteriaceae bacterium]|nr:hypothetical protein [Acidobacteriaceae bacterium]